MVKSLLKKIPISFKDELVLHTAIVFIGTTISALFNLLYHFISVRLLSTEDYGTFNALISLVMVSSTAVSPLSASFVRFFTEYVTKKDFTHLRVIFFKIIRRLCYFALFIFFLFFLFSSAISVFIKTTRNLVIVCGLMIALTIMTTPFLSLIQSYQKFKTFSLLSIISTFIKLICGFFLMLFGFGVIGSMFGFLSGSLAALFISAFVSISLMKDIKPAHPATRKEISLASIYKYCFPVFIAMVSYMALTNVDIILVKHFFSPQEAGYYAVAQMVAKVLLFLPSALAIVIFPKSTQSFVNNIGTTRLLVKSIAIAGGLCFFVSILYCIFPNFILSVITAKANPISSQLVGIFSIAMSFYALVWITMNFLLATHNVGFVWPLLFLAISQTAMIYLFRSSLLTVVEILLLFSIISFMMTLIFGLRRRKAYQVGPVCN